MVPNVIQSGTVPTEIGNLRRMEIFQVEGNDLTGVMPDEVCANTQFPAEELNILGADCSEVSVSSQIMICVFARCFVLTFRPPVFVL